MKHFTEKIAACSIVKIAMILIFSISQAAFARDGFLCLPQEVHNSFRAGAREESKKCPNPSIKQCQSLLVPKDSLQVSPDRYYLLIGQDESYKKQISINRNTAEFYLETIYELRSGRSIETISGSCQPQQMPSQKL
ncbi:hypothetical protein GFK26_12540 [Variovorax paradoxus]|uniref:Uncharacterized protein n=1 Tax=Variovorax paradoxus TaxID=34073 RepID=A0A5Q0M2R0_VARPD|nr:hypothetical protein [Variovorax paradoxus]QFZ83528.1 hypothetical protein GFK26_12540 [Variovorax paradoxus]